MDRPQALDAAEWEDMFGENKVIPEVNPDVGLLMTTKCTDAGGNP